jgi:hypothetical protein
MLKLGTKGWGREDIDHQLGVNLLTMIFIIISGIHRNKADIFGNQAGFHEVE